MLLCGMIMPIYSPSPSGSVPLWTPPERWLAYHTVRANAGRVITPLSRISERGASAYEPGAVQYKYANDASVLVCKRRCRGERSLPKEVTSAEAPPAYGEG